jgi:hypothetical protein
LFTPNAANLEVIAMQHIRQIIQKHTTSHDKKPAPAGPLNQWLAVFAPLPLAY